MTLDLNEAVPYVGIYDSITPEAGASYEPGPTSRTSLSYLNLCYVDPNWPRYPLWILKISSSSRAFLG